MTDPDTPILANTLPTFQKLPPTFKQLLLHTNKKVVYATEPVPSRKESTKLLTDNLRAHIYPDNSLIEDKAIQWYQDLLLNNKDHNVMIGFNNGILIAYRICPPCELLVPKEKLFIIDLLLMSPPIS